jgi:SAM-dependent methyltransferase
MIAIHKAARAVRRLERRLLQRVYGFDRWHVGHAGEPYGADIVRYLNQWAEADRQAVVDIGCGLGDIIRHLHFRTPLGLDRDPRVLAAARLLSVFRRRPGLKFEVFEFPEAQLSGEYNAIIMINWIHEIEPSTLRQTVHRYFEEHLRHGGCLVLDTVQDSAYTYNHEVGSLAPHGALIDRLGRYARNRDVWVVRRP